MSAVLTFLFGLFGLLADGHFVVSGAKQIATALGVPELIAGLTVVALGGRALRGFRTATQETHHKIG